MALEGELSCTQGVTCSCGEKLPFEVLQSAAGYYLGYFCPRCGPWSRESEYFPSFETAEAFLKSLQEEGDTSKLRTTEHKEGDLTAHAFEDMQAFQEWMKAYFEDEK